MATLQELLAAQASAASSLDTVNNNISTLQSYVGDSKYDQTKVSAELSTQTGYLTDINSYLGNVSSSITEKRVNIAKRVNYDIPNAKEKGQWLAGGGVRNGTFAGGSQFSLYKRPSYNNKKRGGDLSTALLNGEIEAYLNKGRARTQNRVNGGEMFDLMKSHEVSKTFVYSYTVTATDTNSGTILGSASNMVSINVGGGRGGSSLGAGDVTVSGVNGGFTDLGEIETMYNNQFDMMGAIVNQNPIDLAISISSLTLGKDMSFSQTMGAGLMGSAMSAITSTLSATAVKALGVTTQYQAYAVKGIVGLVVGELAEIALGLDNSFGFGGEYDAATSQRLGVNAYEAARGFMGVESFADEVAFSLGLDGITRSYENYDGTLTYSTRTYDSNGDMTGGYDALGEYGVREITETYISETVDYTMRDISDDYGGTTGWSSDGSTFSGYEGMGSFEADSRSVGLDSSDDASSSGGSDGGDSGRYCCTVMVKRGLWERKKLVHLGVWDKKQSIIWQEGYKIGGKIIADHFNKDHKIPYYSKMMDGFYDWAIKKKKPTKWTYHAWVWIYPIVWVTGVYSVSKKIMKNIWENFSSVLKRED